MSQFISVLLLQICILSCNNHPNSFAVLMDIKSAPPANSYTQIKKIPLPEGFERTAADSGSFSNYLRNTGLKKDMIVYLYNGKPKQNQAAQFALLDISTGTTDLQQCADAVMRLRAEYLFSQKQYDELVFYDSNKTPYKFSSPYTRNNFTTYLNRVFGMCGSASLSKQLKPVTDFLNIESGDVLIRGGFPGHAVIVMDVAVNAAGRKIYLLAQGYMPAQDMHVLINPMNPDLSPWYEVNDNEIIHTPEYTFTKHELKHW